LSSILGILLAIPGVLCAGFALYLVILALLAFGDRLQPRRDRPVASRLVVLIPAHNEEGLIGRCVGSLLEQTYPRHLFRVVVVADNCTDRTADSASAAGAEVWHREAPDARGKGHALHWAISRLHEIGASFDAIVIVDADSIADPEMLGNLEMELAAGHEVVQADYRWLSDAASPRSAMIAAGFLLFHRVRFTGRARMGMAASLVGNGMLFSDRVLEQHPWDAFTGVEDLEYTMRLRLAGIRPRFAPGALVWGPGAATHAGVDQQRIRWEGGRFHAMRVWLLPLVAAGVIDAALDLATPPLGLLSLVTIAGFVLTALAVIAHLAAAWSLAPWVISVVGLPSFVAIGLAAVGSGAVLKQALLGAPGYLLWKLRTYAGLARGFNAWKWERSSRSQDADRTLARIEIAGVPIDIVDMGGALRRLRSVIKGTPLFQVSTVNLDFVVRAQHDPEIRRIFRQSDLNLADGAPVVWLGRLMGARMPARVAGADLVPKLMSEAAQCGARVFLLGGEGGVAGAAANRIADMFPGIQIAGTYEPPRAEIQDMDNEEILSRIKAAKPDVLLVAFGNPKQEIWIDRHRDKLTVSLAIGVGCVFDLLAGRVRRAPLWMQMTGLEWLYRLLQEPRRLILRYLTDVFWLGPIVARVLKTRLVAQALTEAT